MRIVDEGVIFAGRPKTDASSVVFPSICVLPTGRWLAGVRVAPAKSARASRSLVLWSDDQGRSWSEPVEPVGPLKVAGRPGSWRACALTALDGQRVLAIHAWEDCSNPFVPMFNEQTEGLVDMKLFWSVSEDAGRTFSRPRRVGCGRYDKVPTPITGPALVMPDGRWAVQFEVNKHYLEPTPWQHRSCLTFSSNAGRTWGGVVDVHTDPQRRIFCWDQRPTVLPDGSVLDVFWTFDKSQNKYLNIQARVSRDSGRTWGELYDTGVPDQPAPPVGFAHGRVVMVHMDRTAEPMVVARLSLDHGRTWPAEHRLVVHQRAARSQTWDKGSMQDAWAEMSAYSIGLPTAVRLSERELLTAFYSGDRPDHTDARWARIEV